MATLDLGYGANADDANPYLGQNNPYLQNIVDLTSRDLVDNYNRVVTPAQNQAAIRSGSFGNTGLDEMNMAQQKQLQTSLADSASKLRFNDYTQQQQMYQTDANRNEQQRQFDLGYGRSLYNDAYGQNLQNLQTGLGLINTLNGYNTQDINNSTTQQNAPLQYWQQFMQGANAAGSGGGQSVTTQGTTSNPIGAALGGAQLGNSFGNWWNNGGGGSANTGITGTSGGSGMANYGATVPTTNFFGG